MIYVSLWEKNKALLHTYMMFPIPFCMCSQHSSRKHIETSEIACQKTLVRSEPLALQHEEPQHIRFHCFYSEVANLAGKLWFLRLVHCSLPVLPLQKSVVLIMFPARVIDLQISTRWTRNVHCDEFQNLEEPPPCPQYSWTEACVLNDIPRRSRQAALDMVHTVRKQGLEGIPYDWCLDNVDKDKSVSVTLMWLIEETEPDAWQILRESVLHGGSDGRNTFKNALEVRAEERKNAQKMQCASCASVHTKKLRKCDGCHRVRYCNRACQKTNWRVHKTICTTLKEQRKHLSVLESTDTSKEQKNDAILGIIKANALIEANKSTREAEVPCLLPQPSESSRISMNSSS